MADNRIGLEVDIPVGEAEKGVKSLRAQIAALKKEIATLDEADPKFDKLVKEAAALEDKMGDINQRVKALASDTSKLEGFTAAVSGIAGGFAAAQGAVALFAGENEDLQKSMLKVQAAMTLLNGIQEVANQLNKDSAASIFLKAQAEKLYALAVGQSSGALKKFRLALIATGLGALVVLIGAIVTNWDRFKDAILNLIPGLTKARDFIMGLVNGFTDLIGVTSEAERALDKYNEALAEGVEANKRYVQVLEAQGKDTLELRKKILQDELQLLEVGSQEYLDKVVEYQVLIASADLKAEEERTKKEEEAANKRKAQREKDLEKEKQDNDKRIEEAKRKEEQIQGIIDQTRKDLELGAVEGQEKDLLALQMAYDEQVALVEGNEEALKLLNAKFQQDREAIKGDYAAKEREILYDNLAKEAEIQKKADEDKLKAEQALQEAKRNLAISSAQGILGALKDINTAFAGDSEKAARKAFGIQKALALAETVISTYSAAQAAYASQLTIPSPDAPIRAAIAAGVAIASGLARAAVIAKQEFKGGSTAAPAAGGGAQASLTQTPQLNADVPRQRLSSGDRGELEFKTYVVESEITNTQSRVAAIDRKATVR